MVVFIDEPFFFSYRKDSEGGLAFGSGTNEDPFIVGITSKALLKGLMKAYEAACDAHDGYHLQVRLN